MACRGTALPIKQEDTGSVTKPPDVCVSHTLARRDGSVVVHVEGTRLSLNCGHQQAYSSRKWSMSVGRGGMILTGETE
jgi:hypothetical protein